MKKSQLTESLDGFEYIMPESGSFALYTVQNRLPKILEDVINNNSLTPTQHSELKALADNIPEFKVKELELHIEEEVYWKNFMNKYFDKALITI
ncbi:MAG: hypothetical protein AAGI38_07140, partial [Bacteroidota bacterium]